MWWHFWKGRTLSWKSLGLPRNLLISIALLQSRWAWQSLEMCLGNLASASDLG